jgi:hypothetical protein
MDFCFTAHPCLVQVLLYRGQQLQSGKIISDYCENGSLVECGIVETSNHMKIASRLAEGALQERSFATRSHQEIQERQTFYIVMQQWEKECHRGLAHAEQSILLTATQQGHHLYVRELLM